MTRIVIFSHDSYGLGHLRRSVLIADALTASNEATDCVIITGSPRALAFKLPERVDAVKIPSITKSHDGSYVARKLHQDRASVLAFRSALTIEALRSYNPDIVLVDHAPTGAGQELVPVLKYLSTAPNRPRVVLGLRDIIDDAKTVDRQWRAHDIWSSLDFYDEVLVYGDRAITTTADELGLASRLDKPVSHVGYVAPQMPGARSDDPFILVTAGGGGDGHHLIRRTLDAAEAGVFDLPLRIVSGPLLSKTRQAELMSRTERLRNVDLIDFTPDLRQWISSATALVSMAGYNTTVEAIAAGVPTLLVPRSDFRAEQRIRAERVSAIAAQIDSVSDPRHLRSSHFERLLERSSQAGSGSTASNSQAGVLDLMGARRSAGLLHASAAASGPVLVPSPSVALEIAP